MQEDVWQTIIFKQSGGPQAGGTPLNAPQNKTFDLLNTESCNSQCRKMFGRQLFSSNLEVLRQEEPPQMPPKIKL